MSPRPNSREPVEPQVLAEQLRQVSDEVADQLLQPAPETLHALAQAAELVELAALSQRAVIAAARSRGVSWSTVGGVLGITRQAAFQRFGQGAAKAPPENVVYAEAAAISAEVLTELRDGRWDAVIARCSGVIRSDLGETGLREAWEITIEGGNDVLGSDPARVRRVGAVTVAETLLGTANGDQVMRLTFNAEGLIIGIWFDHPTARATPS